MCMYLTSLKKKNSNLLYTGEGANGTALVVSYFLCKLGSFYITIFGLMICNFILQTIHLSCLSIMKQCIYRLILYSCIQFEAIFCLSQYLRRNVAKFHITWLLAEMYGFGYLFCYVSHLYFLVSKKYLSPPYSNQHCIIFVSRTLVQRLARIVELDQTLLLDLML